jgi:hypothetical protein
MEGPFIFRGASRWVLGGAEAEEAAGDGHSAGGGCRRAERGASLSMYGASAGGQQVKWGSPETAVGRPPAK